MRSLLRSCKLVPLTDSRTTNDNLINQTFGGSIADRKRALQENGLVLGSHKPLSRDIPIRPLSPTHPSSVSNTTSPLPSAHTFVPASSFGPPSPVSSPSSSPIQNTHFDLSGFAQSFPSIDELNKNLIVSSNSEHTGGNIASSKSSTKGDIPPPSPSINLRNFPLHIDRPSSTPITPTGNNVFNSRPASPMHGGVNMNVSAPHKPSGLSLSSAPTAAFPTQPVGVPVKPPIPKTNTAFPKDLQGYMRDYAVLIIDVRNRADFDREHIKAQNIICIEPTVLMRDK